MRQLQLHTTSVNHRQCRSLFLATVFVRQLKAQSSACIALTTKYQAALTIHQHSARHHLWPIICHISTSNRPSVYVVVRC